MNALLLHSLLCHLVTVPNPKAAREPRKTFTFDTVFGPESAQAELYNETARVIVDAVLQGYNGIPRALLPSLQPSSFIPNLSLLPYLSLPPYLSLLPSLSLSLSLSLSPRHYICLWSDWHRQDIHNGWGEDRPRAEGNHSKLICSHLWSHSQV